MPKTSPPNESKRWRTGADRSGVHDPSIQDVVPKQRVNGGVNAATSAGTAPAVAKHGSPRPSRALVVGLIGFVLVFGTLGYAWRGNVDGLSIDPGKTDPVVSRDGAGGTITRQQVDAMLEALVERLKQRPEDAEGWSMLARGYAALGRDAEALTAYRKAAALRPTDAQALADLADSLMANGSALDSEPERLVMEAVRLDPRNLKALAVAGSIALEKGDFQGAAGFWQRASNLSEPGSRVAHQLQLAAEDARRRAGLDGTPAAAAAATMPQASTVAGRVRLDEALRGKVAPGDTLFIFARAAAGSKVPLAVLRKQASDLPLEFTLDDSLAMSQAAKLSSAAEIVIGARISKSGSAMPQPGDFQALSAPVSVGTRGVNLEINEVVR